MGTPLLFLPITISPMSRSVSSSRSGAISTVLPCTSTAPPRPLMLRAEIAPTPAHEVDSMRGATDHGHDYDHHHLHDLAARLRRDGGGDVMVIVIVIGTRSPGATASARALAVVS
jgi:hypothetical protein